MSEKQQRLEQDSTIDSSNDDLALSNSEDSMSMECGGGTDNTLSQENSDGQVVLNITDKEDGILQHLPLSPVPEDDDFDECGDKACSSMKAGVELTDDIGLTSEQNVASRKIKAKQQIAMNKRQKQKEPKYEFRKNLVLACRTAVGTLLVGCLQLRLEGTSIWLPDYYFLGGLSYATIMVIFLAGKTLGETLKEALHTIIGLLLAILNNLLLFGVLFTSTQEDLVHVSLTFGSSDGYFVSQRDVLVFVPTIFIFTFIITSSALEIDTKKFAVALNAFFTLTLMNPNDSDSGILKPLDTDVYKLPNLLRNFMLYVGIGMFGVIIAVTVMLLPKPVLAISEVKARLLEIELDVEEMLNMMLDVYSFKDKSSGQVQFVHLTLTRRIQKARSNYTELVKLLDDVWWEQLLGIHVPLGFHKGAAKQHIELYRRLVRCLRGMKNSMEIEDKKFLLPDNNNASAAPQQELLESLHTSLYRFQRSACAAYKDISMQILQIQSTRDVVRTKIREDNVGANLVRHTEKLLKDYRKARQQGRGNIEFDKSSLRFNVFLFNLVSFSDNIIDFPSIYNQKRFDLQYRVVNAAKRYVSAFCTLKRDRQVVLKAFKVTIAVTLACFPAIYVFKYSPSAPSTIAIIIGNGNHIGGSFQRTVNRVIGVIVGSIIPGIIMFFACAAFASSPIGLIVARSVLLGAATVLFIQIYVSKSFFAYSGLVSAFISAETFLGKCSSTQEAIEAYSYLVQVSLGVSLFIAVEVLIAPKSAATLVRLNLESILSTIDSSFDTLFQHLTGRNAASAEDLATSTRHITMKLYDDLLVQKVLIFEANLEPDLWRPPFMAVRHTAIRNYLREIRHSLNLWNGVLRWQNRRNEVALSLHRKPKILYSSPSSACNWDLSAFEEYQTSVHEALESIKTLCSDKYASCSSESATTFLQLKEAFRKADPDSTGKIDVQKLREWLLRIFRRNHVTEITDEEIEACVDSFMINIRQALGIPDEGKRFSISLVQLIDAIEAGLEISVDQPVVNRPQNEMITSAASPTSGNSSVASEVASELGEQMLWHHRVLSFQEDGLNLERATQRLLQEYVTWLQRWNNGINVDRMLVVSCFIDGAVRISENLSEIHKILVTL